MGINIYIYIYIFVKTNHAAGRHNSHPEKPPGDRKEEEGPPPATQTARRPARCATPHAPSRYRWCKPGYIERNIQQVLIFGVRFHGLWGTNSGTESILVRNVFQTLHVCFVMFF